MTRGWDRLKAALTTGGALFLLCACAPEKREIAASQPSSPPTGPNDPRAPYYERNAYQVSQGGRLFGWYGCKDCHGQEAPGARNLSDPNWAHGGRPGEVFASIAEGEAHAYSRLITDDQLWQLTAYVRRLRDNPPPKLRRQDADTVGEPQSAKWEGPQP